MRKKHKLVFNLFTKKVNILLCSVTVFDLRNECFYSMQMLRWCLNTMIYDAIICGMKQWAYESLSSKPCPTNVGISYLNSVFTFLYIHSEHMNLLFFFFNGAYEFRWPYIFEVNFVKFFLYYHLLHFWSVIVSLYSDASFFVQGENSKCCWSSSRPTTANF